MNWIKEYIQDTAKNYLNAYLPPGGWAEAEERISKQDRKIKELEEQITNMQRWENAVHNYFNFELHKVQEVDPLFPSPQPKMRDVYIVKKRKVK